MEKSERWKQRLVSFEKSLNKVLEITDNIDLASLSEIERDSLIKRFELTFELSWNVLKDFLELQVETGLFGSRNTFQTAFRRGLIGDGEKWMQMIESLIMAAHVYDEEKAVEIAVRIYDRYIYLFKKLSKSMEDLARNEKCVWVCPPATVE